MVDGTVADRPVQILDGIFQQLDDGAISGPTESMEEFVKELQTRVKITFEKNVKEYTGIGIDYDVEAASVQPEKLYYRVC